MLNSLFSMFWFEFIFIIKYNPQSIGILLFVLSTSFCVCYAHSIMCETNMYCTHFMTLGKKSIITYTHDVIVIC